MSDRATSSSDTPPASEQADPSSPEPDCDRAGSRDERSAPNDQLEFGPSGYLPERASKRARKIVLRAPLGIEWVIASAVAGAVVLAAGLVFLLSTSDGPGDPYVRVGEVAQLDAAHVDPATDALIVAAGGRIRAFADAADVAYCEASNRLEAADGRVWSLTGRGLGTESLAEHTTVVHDGVLYVDPTRSGAAADPSSEPAEPACS